ncbi:hypothetical protein [Streptomyces scopuliridis]|uniref:hypothetical protein n=1 Tax=Streptomyces scopuliridis TaxID=452529 RepID=UPI00368B6E42
MTAADALVELLAALARRQHEHRERTAERLTAVVATGLLPAELHEMTVYYLAKAQRDLGRTEASRAGMRLEGRRRRSARPRGTAGTGPSGAPRRGLPHRPRHRRNARLAGPPAPCPG